MVTKVKSEIRKISIQDFNGFEKKYWQSKLLRTFIKEIGQGQGVNVLSNTFDCYVKQKSRYKTSEELCELIIIIMHHISILVKTFFFPCPNDFHLHLRCTQCPCDQDCRSCSKTSKKILTSLRKLTKWLVSVGDPPQ